MPSGYRPRRLPLLAALLTALLAIGGLAAPASARVAPDANQVVRDIVFPVVGKYTFINDFGDPRSGGRQHAGNDIMAAKLTPAVAARDATVVGLKDTATPDGSQGNYLMLRDAQGWEYWYIHLNNDTPGTDDGANPKEWIFGPGIHRGAKVKAGQLVAYVGDSGNAEWTAPHLHFEIHKPDGSIINPYKSLVAAPRLASPVEVTPNGSQAFVTALYADFIGRNPTDVEMAAQLGQLVSGVSRGDVVASFTRSDQWIGAMVDGYYRSTLGRGADAAGKAHWTKLLRDGWTPARVAAEFYGSAEYFHRVGGTNEAWVRDLYDELLHRPADRDGLPYWVGQLADGMGRQEISHAFYQSLETRRVRVAQLYDDLLGRAPDHEGHGYWARVLLDGNDLRLAVHLAGSDEYLGRAQGRFGS